MSRGHIRERVGPRSTTFEVRVFAGIDPITGKRKYLTKSEATKNLAEKRLTKMLTALDDGTDTPGADAAFSRLLTDWQRLKAAKWSPKTQMETAGYIERWIAPTKADHPERWVWAPGRLKLDDITTARLDAFYTELAEHLKPATIRRIHGVVHAALEQAVRWDWIPRNPASRTESIEGRSAEIVPPTDDNVKHLIGSLAKEPEIAMFVRLAAVTGRRRGELCALRWTDVDFDASEITVARTLADSKSNGWVERPISKNKTRFPPIAVDANTVASLKAHREASIEKLATLGLELPDDGWVFYRLKDQTVLAPWSPDGASRRFARARDAAKLPASFRLHDLRHWAATAMVDAGVPLTTAGPRLGHGSGGRTTQAVYGHRVAATDQAAADLLDSKLS